jgi:hypothetical protein
VWELSGGLLRCGCCGWRMRTCVTRRSKKQYFYYACANRREGREACPNRRSYRARSLESAVWRVVRNLLADADKVSGGFDAMIRQAHKGERGNPGVEARAWLERLAEADRTRSNYQEMAAKGLMTFDELGARLEELENARRIALQGLETIRDRREGVAQLERDRDHLVGTYAGLPPDLLDDLEAEERQRIYRMLRLRVLVGADGTLTVSGIAGAKDLKTTGRDLRFDAA